MDPLPGENEIELLFKAVCASDIATVREFIQLIDVNEKDQFGASLLHHSAAIRNPAITICLLENNAEPNCYDQKRWTPLHTACSNAHLEVQSKSLWFSSFLSNSPRLSMLYWSTKQIQTL